MTDGKKDQLKRKKTLEYELRRLYRAGELTEQQIAELKEAEFPFDTPVRRTAKSVVRIDDGKKWPSCSAAEKELGITQGWMSDVCNMAQNGKWVAIKNQFYCFESMYSPDMDLTEIRGLAGWIVILETGEMFPTTGAAAKAAGTSRSVVLDHVKNKVKPQNKRFSYVRDWDGKVGRLVDLNVQMICLETDTIYHSYDEICAAIWSDGYDWATRKEIVQKVGDAIRHGCPAFDMFSIVPVEAVILIVISVVPVIFHAKCLGFKKTVFSFETMMISGLLFLSLMTWRNELLLLGILMIVYSTWCWKLEPKCKVSSKMLSRIVLFSISVVALEFGAVLFYSTLSATDQKSISIERAFQAMREDVAVSGTAVLTDIDPGCRAELNGFKPYLDTRIEVFNGQNGQKNVLAEAGKALSSGSLSAICDDYGMDYAVLNYGINDVGIQDLEESGFKPVYSDNLTVCLKRSTV